MQNKRAMVTRVGVTGGSWRWGGRPLPGPLFTRVPTIQRPCFPGRKERDTRQSGSRAAPASLPPRPPGPGQGRGDGVPSADRSGSPPRSGPGRFSRHDAFPTGASEGPPRSHSHTCRQGQAAAVLSFAPGPDDGCGLKRGGPQRPVRDGLSASPLALPWPLLRHVQGRRAEWELDSGEDSPGVGSTS